MKQVYFTKVIKGSTRRTLQAGRSVDLYDPQQCPDDSLERL